MKFNLPKPAMFIALLLVDLIAYLSLPFIGSLGTLGFVLTIGLVLALAWGNIITISNLITETVETPTKETE